MCQSRLPTSDCSYDCPTVSSLVIRRAEICFRNSQSLSLSTLFAARSDNWQYDEPRDPPDHVIAAVARRQKLGPAIGARRDEISRDLSRSREIYRHALSPLPTMQRGRRWLLVARISPVLILHSATRDSTARRPSVRHCWRVLEAVQNAVRVINASATSAHRPRIGCTFWAKWATRTMRRPIRFFSERELTFWVVVWILLNIFIHQEIR